MHKYELLLTYAFKKGGGVIVRYYKGIQIE